MVEIAWALAIRCSDFPRTQHTFKRIKTSRGGTYTHSLLASAVSEQASKRTNERTNENGATKIRRACARRVHFSSFLELLRPFFWWVGRVFHRSKHEQATTAGWMSSRVHVHTSARSHYHTVWYHIRNRTVIISRIPASTGLRFPYVRYDCSRKRRRNSSRKRQDCYY